MQNFLAKFIKDKRGKTMQAHIVINDEIVLARSVGFKADVCTEIVFNTSMSGYQEIITDPSYKDQIITFTYPHIGNTGINEEDLERKKPHLKAIITKNIPNNYSNFRATTSLTKYLIQNKIVCLTDVDTRNLVLKIREKGVSCGAIIIGDMPNWQIKEKAKNLQQQKNNSQIELKNVSRTDYKKWQEGTWQLNTGYKNTKQNKKHIVAYDFGIKNNILRLLADRAKITVVPFDTNITELKKLNPDGVFLSNGPGDPKNYLATIDLVKEIIKLNLPTFGICLGHQLLALALGLKTTKMKFGHRGANHPVLDLETKKIAITSQNHGYCILNETMPKNIQITHTSLFDGTIQGIKLKDKPVFSFQGHPEASPGPHDLLHLFDDFIKLMD